MATPVTESSLLANFLLPPAPLPALISLKTFTALFPHSQRSSPAIRALYRNLQSQRLQTIDKVNQNIVIEAKRGSRQRNAFIRARREEKDNNYGDEEIELEESVFGPSCNLPMLKPLTLKSIIPELTVAVEDLKAECQTMEENEKALLDEIWNIVRGLSDLKYGKLGNPRLRNQVVDRCSRLEKVCDAAMRPAEN